MAIEKLTRNDGVQVSDVKVVTDLHRLCHNCKSEVEIQIELIEGTLDPKKEQLVQLALSYECAKCGSESITGVNINF